MLKLKILKIKQKVKTFSQAEIAFTIAGKQVEHVLIFVAKMASVVDKVGLILVATELKHLVNFIVAQG